MVVFGLPRWKRHTAGSSADAVLPCSLSAFRCLTIFELFTCRGADDVRVLRLSAAPLPRFFSSVVACAWLAWPRTSGLPVAAYDARSAPPTRTAAAASVVRV